MFVRWTGVEWFRVNAVLPVAVIRGDGPPPTLAHRSSRATSDRARMLVNRLGWRDSEVRDAVSALLDVVMHLEGEVNALRDNLSLAEAGIELRNELVSIGADGLTLQRGFAGRGGVHVYLRLPVHGAEPLVVFAGQAEGREVTFTTDQHQRDLLVAFTFEHQGRERRHARAVADAAKS